MASNRWNPSALPRAQVDTLTLGGTWAANDTITLTINTKQVILTVGSTFTTTVIADNILEAVNESSASASFGSGYSTSEYGSAIAEFTEITAAKTSTTTVTFTSVTKGKPFTLSVSRTTGASGTVSLSTTTAATGPNHWNDASNWSLVAVPVTGINEQQTITVDATSGTFTVTFGGQTTIATAFNAAASLLQTNLEALSTIGTGNIGVAGGPGAAGGGTPYTLTFQNALGYQNVAPVTTGAGSLSGGASTAAVATTVGGSAGDDVYLDYSDSDILYGLSQSAVILNSLNIAATFTGTIGLPKTNADGTAYPEYRTDYLAIGAVSVLIGQGPGSGSSRLKLNFGSTINTTNVLRTATGAESDLPAVLLKGTNAYNTLNVDSADTCSVGVAVFGGETATLSVLKVDGSADLRGGAGLTVTTLTQDDGTLLLAGAVTTWNMNGGSAEIDSGGVTTLTIYGGSVTWNSTGALGTCTVTGTGSLDFGQDARTKVVTNAIALVGPQSQIDERNGVVGNFRVVFTGGAGAGQVAWGSTYTLTRS